MNIRIKYWEKLKKNPYKKGRKAEKMVLDIRKKKGRKQKIPD